MPWLLLLVAGLLEVAWTCSMKLSDGFTRLVPSLVTVVLVVVSFALLSMSMRAIPLGTAYAIWSGIGAIGAFVIGALVFGEQLSLVRIAGLLMIVGGLALMKFATPN